MRDVDVAHTRNFALIGHAADGKTTLGEALLQHAGATASLGSVDAGTSVLDAGPEERDRHHTLSSAFFAFDWDGHHLTLVDTPGDASFRGDGVVALRGLDGGVLVISATDGVKVGSESAWQEAAAREMPLLAFVNGLDRERADFDAAVESLRRLGANAVPVALPVGLGPAFRGLVDLVAQRAWLDGAEGEVPEELRDAAADARRQLVEAVAETDDTLLEHYLEEGELADEEVRRGLAAAIRSRALLPVLCGAALGGAGVPTLLAGIVRWLPSPADRPPVTAAALEGDGAVALAADPQGPLAAWVLKTVIDRYAGTLSLLRIVSGTLKPDSALVNATRGERERVGKLLLMRGVEHVDVPEAGPGDLVAVAKLKGVHTGDALTQEKGGVRLAPIAIPSGALAYAIEAPSKGEEEKVFASLARLVHEDPTLHLERDPATGEFLLTGVSELHIRITTQKLKRLYDLEVVLKTPKIPYRETISQRVENVEGKLKKQTGGKGMFGVCYLSVEPLPRGAGIEFNDEIVGGAIPRNLIPAVEKGVREAAVRGPLAGFPVVDIRVRCTDGKHHSVDSNEMAFKLAGSFGFRAAVEQAHPTLLEPIMRVEVAVPEDHVGDVMGDISSRRGRVQTTEMRGSTQVIKAEVPMADMLEYASALTSLTGGKGSFHMEFSRYDEVPAQLREKIVAEASLKPSAET